MAGVRVVGSEGLEVLERVRVVRSEGAGEVLARVHLEKRWRDVAGRPEHLKTHLKKHYASLEGISVTQFRQVLAS